MNETWYTMAAVFYASPEYTTQNRDNTGFVTEAAVAQSDGKIIVAGRQGDLAALEQRLARAQELSGDLESALKTLDRLVQAYPATRVRDEAQFRRGELLFTLRDYPNAEKAYAITMKSAATRMHRSQSRRPARITELRNGRCCATTMSCTLSRTMS